MSSKEMSIVALSSLAILLGSSHPAMAHKSATEADKIDLIGDRLSDFAGRANTVGRVSGRVAAEHRRSRDAGQSRHT
jgi:hypothetical protein